MSRRGINRFIDQNLSRVSPRHVVLNIGSGGLIAERIRGWRERTGFRLWSLDIDPTYGPDVVGDITADPLAGDAFDWIFMLEVLEHVKEPQRAIENICRALKPGGRLVLSTPFLFPLHDRPNDYFRYTEYGLRHLCRDLRAVEVTPRDDWVNTISVLAGRLFMEPGIRYRIAGPPLVLLLLAVQPALWIIGRLFPTDYCATGYVLTGLKPGGDEAGASAKGDGAEARHASARERS